MSLRAFTDRDGQKWNAWSVRPTTTSDSALHARYRDGWICFQRADGTGRCRLPLDEVPPGWDVLPDARLDLIRRVAEQPVNDRILSDTSQETRHSLAEDSARDGVSGPRQVVGRDGEPPPASD